MFRVGVATIGTASAAAVALTATNSSTSANKPTIGADPIAPSDLPIYPSADANAGRGCHAKAADKPTGVLGFIHDGVHTARENVEHVYNEAGTYIHRADDFYQTGKEHSRVLADYLNEPDNSLPRAGAIALGTAAGYILGLRHGRIRRLLYTGIGGAAVASICYPNDAKVYGNRALDELKGVAKIGYNFAYGVKPGDEPVYPKLPTTSAELLESASELLTAAKQKISSATIQISNDKPKKSD